LFRFLPKYQKVISTDERDALLIGWIKSFGELPEIKIEPNEFEIIKAPDHAWIEAQESTLQSALMYVYERRHQGDHYYIGLHQFVGNPDFKNENSYAKMTFPDDGFRLLSLYRYWNMIHYFFPNTHLMDKDWNTVLKEYIPIFIKTKDELAYEKAAIRLIGEIQDTHASLGKGSDQLQVSKGSFFSTIKVKFIEDQLVVTGFYDVENTTDLKIGDVITKVHGKSTMAWVKENAPYYPASNRPTMLRNMTRNILRFSEEEMSIEFTSENSKRKSIDLPLYTAEGLGMYKRGNNSETPSFKMLENNIGYVTLATITEDEVEALKKEFKRTDGIIIDIRNYPNTFVPFSLGSYFLSEETSFVKFTQGNPNNPGEFVMTEPLSIPSEGKTYKGKLIVLVNEDTQSQAEYTSMAFRASKSATIVGSTTAGADGNVSSIVLPGGLGTRISGIGILYPDGSETQRVGIVPDIEVKPTIKGIKEGRDELKEKEIESILEEKLTDLKNTLT
jgi:C-terminal processing protease CtpA/Prc